MTSRVHSRGVTLIELLIAMTLLSLLSAGILTALHTGANAMGKARQRLMDNRRKVGVQRILEQQVAGFMPVMADCQPQPDRPPQRIRFFEGEPQSMRFVSAFSLGEGWRGTAQVLEYQVIPGDRGQGVRLIVNEYLYTGPAGTGASCLGFAPDPQSGVQVPQFRPIVAGPRSFVIADRLASCRFQFRETPPPPMRERWVGRWVLPRWPSAVRIEMAPLESGGTGVVPLTLTAPIRINAEPGAGHEG